ncbi:Ankyrin repeat protein 1 [Giardia muris]|uniref:Ankyrin repeat protein 1 n=1 Tax=Giardia muris TaxID=5742 RepID=A0A4Z1SW36_GIAMU|nr:Ankyrin repeat protein 1 [Giardia muris]|eukprot:TNJ29810.1 Ankyrin repeat protein 1 [Giardia muris]
MVRTELIEAAICGDASAVARHIKQAGQTDGTGKTALMWAAYHGNTECVRVLAAREGGLQIKAGQLQGCTALIFAAGNGHRECVQLLLEREAGFKTIFGHTALKTALYSGHFSIIPLLYPREHESVSFTPLMVAALNGDVDLLRMHMDHLRSNYKGYTALMFAAGCGHACCVRQLLIEANLQTEKTEAIAIAPGHAAIPAGTTALMFAAMNGHAACVPLLQSCESGLQNDAGRSALMYAVECNSVECVRLLAEWEAGLCLRNGVTALMMAAFANRVDCVRSLLCEASRRTSEQITWPVNISDGATALMFAAIGNHPEPASLLLPYEFGLTDGALKTAFTRARELGHDEVAQILAGEDENPLFVRKTPPSRLECLRDEAWLSPQQTSPKGPIADIDAPLKHTTPLQSDQLYVDTDVQLIAQRNRALEGQLADIMSRLSVYEEELRTANSRVCALEQLIRIPAPITDFSEYTPDELRAVKKSLKISLSALYNYLSDSPSH